MNQIIQEKSFDEEAKQNTAKIIETERNSEVEAKKQGTSKKIKKKKTKIKVVLTVILIFMLLICSTIFSIINMNNKTILSGIKINNIDVKGLTKEKAEEVLKNEIQGNGQFIISCEGKEYIILKENLNIEYDFNNAINEAYEQGRNQNIFANNFTILKNAINGKNITMKTEVNRQSLQAEVDRINSEIPEGLVYSSYIIENNKLIIKKGKPGKGINAEKLLEKIIESISNNSKDIIEIETENQIPEEIDIEKIRNEIYVEPKNAYFEKNPFKVYPHVEGIDINIEEAKNILQEDKEEYVIPLVISKPKITTDQIGTEAFPDLLGKCTTKFDERKVGRSTNLRVASKALNGKVIMPGETFSYNRTLGERTYEKGYRIGGGYVGGRNVDMIGGGICQISSTLYNAVIYANLGIVERHAHAHIAGYLDPGRDATVSYGTLDFKFKNTRNNPIMIKASAVNGIATVEIYGIKEEKEYEIEIVSYVANYIGFKTVYENDSTKNVGYESVTQTGMRGCNSSTYKIYKLNGVEVSRELLSKDSFAPMNKIITRGTKGAATNTQESNTVSTPVEQEPVAPIVNENPPAQEVPEAPEAPATPEPIASPSNPEVPEEPEAPSDGN